MKNKIKDFLRDAWDTITDGLKYACGKPTPVKRLVFVLVAGSILSIGYVYMLAHSIYNMGKRDAERELLDLQHIESLKLQGDSINNFNQQDYECE